MKRLTKRRALELCRDLWGWLAEDGTRRKSGWPGWKRVGYLENECPCCEIAKRADEGLWDLKQVKGCKDHCPLAGMWGRTKFKLRRWDLPCERGHFAAWVTAYDSPWFIAATPDPARARRAAMRIHDAAIKALEAL